MDNLVSLDLTEPEWRALGIVALGGGATSWYQVARLITPIEHPGEDVNPVSLLDRIERLGLISPVASEGKMRRFVATESGVDLLSRRAAEEQQAL